MALLREMSQTHDNTLCYSTYVRVHCTTHIELRKLNCLFCYYTYNLMGEEFTEAVILNLLFQLVSFSVGRSEL